MEQEASVIDPALIQELWRQLESWLRTEVFIWSSLVQLGVVISGALIAWPLAHPLRRALERAIARTTHLESRIREVLGNLPPLSFPAIFFVLMLLASTGARSFAYPSHIIAIALSLLAAWLVIRLATSVIENRDAARTIGLMAWGIAALNIVDLLDPLLVVLDNLAIPLGQQRLTALLVIKAVILLAVLLWLAGVAGRLINARLDRSRMLTPSVKVLAEKSVRILMIAAVFLFTLNYIGVDLTAFAVFTGAIGVGVGFGLQKVVSNLISGFILLLDRSIKPGDVIEISDTFGWVTQLSARYITLTTRDGRELLIPNEDLITQQVINWSYTNKLLRIPMRFGVSYHSDVRKAMELAIDAARSVDRVHKDPAPVCRLIGFGDSSVDFELRIWISDPEGGVVNVTSAVYLAIWDRFHEHGIDIPFPQRDITIKPDSRLTVETVRGTPEGGG